MKRFVGMAGALTLALFLGAGEASANIVYNFSGVTFDDGGTLTGTFTTNDAINALLDYDITTSAGTGIGFNYTLATSDASSTSLPFILVANTPPALDNILQLTFDGGLTATGAPLTIGNFDSFEQGISPARRAITGGSAVAAVETVPEPSPLSLAGLGLLGIFFLRRYRRQGVALRRSAMTL